MYVCMFVCIMYYVCMYVKAPMNSGFWIEISTSLASEYLSILLLVTTIDIY